MNGAIFFISAIIWIFGVWACSLILCRLYAAFEKWPEFWLSIVIISIAVPMLSFGILTFFPTSWVGALPFEGALTGIQRSSLAFHAIPASFLHVLFALYGVGASLFLFRIFITYMSLMGQNKTASIGYYKAIPILLVNKGIDPCSFGLFNPKILISKPMQTTLSERQLQMIYAHEYAHIKHNDQRVFLALIILRAIMWPHIAIRDLVNRWSVASELRADAYALKNSNPEQRRIYGKTLIDVLRKKSGGTLPCPSVTLHLSQYRSAKMRVNNIMNPNRNDGKIRHHKNKLLVAAAAIIFGGTLAMNAFAAQSASPDKNAQPLTRVPPIFPSNCPVNEGKYAAKIKLKFDVSTAGRVMNVRVTKSDNPCFNAASIQSTKKWVYAANVRKLKGVETLIVFKLSQ